jgi:hypothetical protein
MSEETEQRCRTCYHSLRTVGENGETMWCTKALYLPTLPENTCAAWRKQEKTIFPHDEETAMNEEREETPVSAPLTIEPAPTGQPIQAPGIPTSVEVPKSVGVALNEWEAMKAKLRSDLAATSDPKLNKAFNLFQYLEQSAMNSVIAFLVNFFTNNLRTTVAGVVFVVGQLCAKYGLEVPQGWSDALFASTSAILFMLSDKSLSWRTALGVVLMLASFFLTPLAGVLGIAASPFALYTAQVLLQGVIAALLKDQPNLLKYSPVQKVGVLFIALLTSCVPAPAQTASRAIPSSFMVAGTEVRVRYDSARCNAANAYGLYNHREAAIYLNDSDTPAPMRLRETFYHELVHCLLETTTFDSLSQNEVFVRHFSRALCQAVSSFRFEPSLVFAADTSLRRVRVSDSIRTKQLRRRTSHRAAAGTS